MSSLLKLLEGLREQGGVLTGSGISGLGGGGVGFGREAPGFTRERRPDGEKRLDMRHRFRASRS